VKPYVPFCDSVEGSSAPEWVAPEAPGAAGEPLAVAGVDVPDAVAREVAQAWGEIAASPHGSLYASAGDVLLLIRQVLSRDIRSLHQRGAKAAASSQEDRSGTLYRVLLDGLLVSYSVDEDAGGSRQIRVRGCDVWAGDNAWGPRVLGQ